MQVGGLSIALDQEGAFWLDWMMDRTVPRLLAEREGIELSTAHLEVIRSLAAVSMAQLPGYPGNAGRGEVIGPAMGADKGTSLYSSAIVSRAAERNWPADCWAAQTG